jgi:hypothetical protein
MKNLNINNAEIINIKDFKFTKNWYELDYNGRIGKSLVNFYFSDEDKHLEVITSFDDGKYLQRINLTSKPSNLGKGLVWFFICPLTDTLCRKLYRCRTNDFLSYKAFKSVGHQLTYHYQNLSKLDRTMSLSRHFKRKLKDLEEKKNCIAYDGKPTKQWSKKNAYWLKSINYEKKAIEVLTSRAEKLYNVT